MNIHEVIRNPVITEKTESIKAATGSDVQRYTLKVHTRANKELIRQALYKIYQVNVVKINVMNVPGKKKRFRSSRIKMPAWKKAIVTLATGQQIDFAKQSS